MDRFKSTILNPVKACYVDVYVDIFCQCAAESCLQIFGVLCVNGENGVENERQRISMCSVGLLARSAEPTMDHHGWWAENEDKGGKNKSRIF